MVIDRKVKATPVEGSFEIKKKEFKLESATEYYWRVYAILPDGSQVLANPERSSFKTTANFFDQLHKQGFRLQKALTGPDKGELAEFSFLDTIGQKKVYSSTFAFSWSPNKQPGPGHTVILPQVSVEGSLASDDSKSEDAWRFQLSSAFVSNFIRCRSGRPPCAGQLTQPTFEGLYTTAS